MTVEVRRTMSEISDVTEQWAALADSAGARHNMHPSWCLPWWSHLGSGELHVATVESGGQLSALAPLYRRRRLGVDTLRFLGSEILGVSEVLVAPGQDAAGDQLWEFLVDQPQCVLDLRQHRQGGPGFDALRHVGSHRWRAALGPASPHATITGSWDDYWDSRRSKFRGDLRRRERIAESENMPVRVEVALDRDDVEKRLPEVTQIFDVAEAAQPMLHFLAGRYRPFTVEMFRNAADQSRLALFVLYLGDTPVATMFTLHNGVTMGAGGCRFDHAFGRFSPGQLLWRHAFEFAFSTGCTEFDLGPRDSFYKRQWSTGLYDTVEISAFSSDAVHALQTGKAVVRRAQAKWKESKRSRVAGLL